MFSLNSKFYQITVICVKFLWTNVLFSILSLGIITIPAAFSALVQVLGNDSDCGIASYFSIMKKSVRPTLPLGLFTIFIVLFYGSLQMIISDSLFVRLIFLLFSCFLVSYTIHLYWLQGVGSYQRNYFLLFKETFIFTVVMFTKAIFFFIGYGILFLFTFQSLPILTALFGISAPLCIYLRLCKNKLCQIQIDE